MMINDIKQIVGERNVHEQALMSRYTSFRVGGPAKAVIEPINIGQLVLLVKYFSTHHIDYLVTGNGSNLVIEDSGLPCYVIRISDQMSHVTFLDNVVRAEAGVLLPVLAKKILAQHLTGFEFASGIPGTLGGAVFMNAGAYGGEFKDIVRSVSIVDPQGNIHNIPAERLNFGYRTSAIKQNHWIVAGADLKLEKDDPVLIEARMKELDEKRVSKQPLDLPSAGSVFKRPPNSYAGMLIDQAGLRGYKIGGAQVSIKHCGFIVNTGSATSADIKALIQYVQEQVKKKFGIMLEREVKYFGIDEE